MGIHGTPLKTVVRWNKLSLLSIIGIKAYFELQLLHRRPGGLPDWNRAQSRHIGVDCAREIICFPSL